MTDASKRLQQSFGHDPATGFKCYFWFVGWWALSLGLHVSLRDPNIEIHLPFGFFRIGWEKTQL